MTAQPKRVLLVDDDADIVEAVRHALEEHGYEVLVARDGGEALRRAERDAPDLILLDLVMPGRSGFAVLDRLSSKGSDSPRIIMMTANTDPEYREYASARGAHAFVNKPFDMGDLMSRVDELLGAPAGNSD